MKTDLFYSGLRVYLTGSGYPSVTIGGKRFLVHRLEMERMIGKDIPENMEVHHLDGNKMNWSPGNLLLLSLREHRIFHAKERIISAGGNPSLHSICYKCERVLPFSEFRKDSQRWNGVTCSCRSCHAANMLEWRKTHSDNVRLANQRMFRKTMGDPIKKAAMLEKQRTWYHKNKEKVLEKQKAKRREKQR